MSYEPLPWQRRMHNSVSKIKWVVAARRSGKTRGAFQEDLRVIDRLSKEPVRRSGKKLTAEQAQLVPAIHVWTVAPTKAQMYQVWNEMQAFIPEHMVSRVNPYRDDYRGNGGRGSGFKEDDLRVWLVFKDRNGRWLPGRLRPIVLWELKSADNPSSLQSAGLDFLHVTEAQDVKEEAWERLSPMLVSPDRAGRALIEGIPPSSPQHWFARNHRLAAEKGNHLRWGFHATYLDNPLLTPDQLEEIEAHRESMTAEAWDRMYLAKQPEGSGAFFTHVSDAMGRNGCSDLMGPLTNRRYVAGLDLGRSNDNTVLVIKDRRSRESVHAVELSRTDWNSQMETIRLEARRWGLEEVVMDSTGLGGKFAYDMLYTELANAGVNVVPFNFTPNDKYHKLFLPYQLALQQGTVSFPPEWKKLVNQLLDIKHSETMNRGHVFTTVSGGHDDWVDAELLALFACDPAQSDIDHEKLNIPMPIRVMQPLNGTPAGYDDFIWINQKRAEKRRDAFAEAARRSNELADTITGRVN